jgi:hypothetical protein
MKCAKVKPYATRTAWSAQTTKSRRRVKVRGTIRPHTAHTTRLESSKFIIIKSLDIHTQPTDIAKKNITIHRVKIRYYLNTNRIGSIYGNKPRTRKLIGHMLFSWDDKQLKVEYKFDTKSYIYYMQCNRYYYGKLLRLISCYKDDMIKPMFSITLENRVTANSHKNVIKKKHLIEMMSTLIYRYKDERKLGEYFLIYKKCQKMLK